MDLIVERYGENCYVKMRCIKLPNSLQEGCENSGRNDDGFTKLLPQKRRISRPTERCRSRCVQRLTAMCDYILIVIENAQRGRKIIILEKN
jgi:hypothetical protein